MGHICVNCDCQFFQGSKSIKPVPILTSIVWLIAMPLAKTPKYLSSSEDVMVFRLRVLVIIDLNFGGAETHFLAHFTYKIPKYWGCSSNPSTPHNDLTAFKEWPFKLSNRFLLKNLAYRLWRHCKPRCIFWARTLYLKPTYIREGHVSDWETWERLALMMPYKLTPDSVKSKFESQPWRR